MKIALSPRKMLLVVAVMSLPFASHYMVDVARSAVCDQKQPENPSPLCGSPQPQCENLNPMLCPDVFDFCITTGVYRQHVPKDCVSTGINCNTTKLLCVWAEDEVLCWEECQCIYNPQTGSCTRFTDENGAYVVCSDADDSYRTIDDDCNCPAGGTP